jgi:molecular chaperone DnaK (HSP70)
VWELYTRYQFETDIQHFLVAVEKVLLDTVAAPGLEIHAIDAVVQTGGSSNIPLFTEMLNRIFGVEKVKASDAFNTVVAGLATKPSAGSTSELLLNIEIFQEKLSFNTNREGEDFFSNEDDVFLPE